MLKLNPTLSIFCVFLSLLINIKSAQAEETALPQSLIDSWEIIKSDYKNFYFSPDHWKQLGVAFAVGGVMANTHTDQYLRDYYQDHWRGARSDDLSKVVKPFGGWKQMVPVTLVATSLEYWMPENATVRPIGQWGLYTLRSYITAAPLMYAGQWLTGASRPNERENASHWRPLEDVNGVSGHAFVGAVPFITIAHMSDNPYIQYAAYAGSVLTAWSRINDDAHFPSQAFLGWCVAYETTDSVFNKDKSVGNRQVSVIPLKQGMDIQLAYQW